MNSIERFYATAERRSVDRPACWLGMPTPSAIPGLCEHFGVKTFEDLKANCGDDFYAVEVPYHSPTSFGPVCGVRLVYERLQRGHGAPDADRRRLFCQL